MPFLWALAAVRLRPGLPVCWAALRCAGCLCCWGGGGWGRARVWHTQVSREGGPQAPPGECDGDAQGTRRHSSPSCARLLHPLPFFFQIQKMKEGSKQPFRPAAPTLIAMHLQPELRHRPFFSPNSVYKQSSLTLCPPSATCPPSEPCKSPPSLMGLAGTRRLTELSCLFIQNK